jgi:tetratricopeptide (TPR) repeat protein
MTEEQLLVRLGSRLDLLRAGRDAAERHQTLRATIEWSYELLNPGEQELFAALSVFRGGWTLDSTERVVGSKLEPLQSLIDKSLISRLPSGRFTMLETVRDFAAERLDPRERDRLLQQLLEYQLDLFANASLSEDPVGPPQMGLANAERPNMDAALTWAVVSGSAEKALRLLVSTEMYWITTDPVGCRERLDGLMAKVRETSESLDLGLHARVVRLRGAALDLTNRYDQSEPEYARAIELFRTAGEDDQIGSLLARIANCALRQGDVERAIPLATQSLEMVRRKGHPADVGYTLFVLAMAAFSQGDVERGTQLAHESAPLTLRGGFPWISGTSLLATAEHLIAAGQLDQAERDLKEGLETLASVSDRINIPYALAAAAAIAALRKQVVRAGILWGALEAVAVRDPRSTTQNAIRENTPYVEGVQGPDFEKGRERGRAFSLDEAVDYALSRRS